MTAAKSTRTTRRRLPPKRDYVALGKLGKLALSEKIRVLRDSGPVNVLDWINEDPILRRHLKGLEQLGRTRTFTVTGSGGRLISNVTSTTIVPGGRLISEVKRTTTVIDIHAALIAQFNVSHVGQTTRNYARSILDKLAVAPVDWLARIRRCPNHQCAQPYFWDDTDSGGKLVHSERCKKAAERQRKSPPVA